MDEDQVVKNLLLVIFQIESQLKSLQSAFEDNQSRGEKIRNEIKKIESENFEVPPEINAEMHSIICLREWHWKYLNRYKNFIDESKLIYLDIDKIANSSGIFVKSKRKKLLQDATNFGILGKKYVTTLGEVFDGNYDSLIPGESIRSEALKLMSERLAAASKARGK
jgi:hypothetical protein